MGTACYLKGGEDLIREFESLLGAGLNSVTATASSRSRPSAASAAADWRRC